jgi:hypothetical protein
MDVILLWLIWVLSVIAIVTIAVRARREQPGHRLAVFLSRAFMLGLGLWTVATLVPLIPGSERVDYLYALYEVQDPARMLAASSFFGLLGILVSRAIDHMSRARPND